VSATPAPPRARPLGAARPALAWAAAAAAVAAAVAVARLLGGPDAILRVDQLATGPATALQDLAGALPFGYALGAGMLAAVNPCGFALLPAYLGLFLGSPDPTRSVAATLGQAARVAATLTAAFVLTFGAAGIVVSAAGAAIGAALPVVGLLVGIALAVAGAYVLSGGRLASRLADRVGGRLAGAARSRGVRAYAAYGIAYAAASLGCALPIFLTVIGLASAAHDPAQTVGQLVLYGVGMGVVVSALTVAAALVKGTLLARVRALGDRLLPPLTGALLVLTGAYVTAYWVTLGFQ